jgi:hypothetical protein
MTFPLPSRWSNPVLKHSMQQLYMVIKQVSLNLQKAGTKQAQQVNTEKDRAKATLYYLDFFKTNSKSESD